MAMKTPRKLLRRLIKKKTVKQVAVELEFLTEAQFDELVIPADMMHPK